DASTLLRRYPCFGLFEACVIGARGNADGAVGGMQVDNGGTSTVSSSAACGLHDVESAVHVADHKDPSDCRGVDAMDEPGRREHYLGFAGEPKRLIFVFDGLIKAGMRPGGSREFQLQGIDVIDGRTKYYTLSFWGNPREAL